MRRCAPARNGPALAIEPSQHEAPALDVTAVGLSASPRRDDADVAAGTGRRRACAGAPKQPRRRSADQASGHDAGRGRGRVRLGRLRWPIARPVRPALGGTRSRTPAGAANAAAKPAAPITSMEEARPRRMRRAQMGRASRLGASARPDAAPPRLSRWSDGRADQMALIQRARLSKRWRKIGARC